MKRRTTILMLLPVLLLPSGCRGFEEDAPAGGRRVAVSVEALVEDYDGAVTKSSLGASETAVSVWGVGAYKDGYLVDWANSTTKPTLNLELGTTYSIFALANTPGAADFFEDLTTEGWHVYNAVESFPGGHYLAGYLPMSSARSYTPAANAQTVSVTFTRLVAKYNVRIEENFADPNSTFTVTGLAMRNSPVSARPFQVLPSGFGIAAQSASEVGDGKDRASAADISTLNSGGTVSLYTLENLQGTTSNTDPWNKTTTAPATYLELTGTWSTSGASATMTYRMYLGNNATNDFNITRNTSYDLTLSLSEAGFGHLGSSWKIERTNFSDSRGVDVEGDFTTNRIIVYDDGEEVQYILSPNYADMDYVVSLDVVDDAGLTWTRTGPANNVLSISTSLRDCLGMPHDEFVITTRDGAELQRVPVEVWHRLDFVDYDLGGEATDPMDVTVGQKLIYSLGNMDIFPDNGYPYANLGFRYGKYSTETVAPVRSLEVHDSSVGVFTILENWALGEPGDLLYLEIFDKTTGKVLTRDGTFYVRKPTIGLVDHDSAPFANTRLLSVVPLDRDDRTAHLMVQYLTPSGAKAVFSPDLLQLVDLEPTVSLNDETHLSIYNTTSLDPGDEDLPRKFYSFVLNSIPGEETALLIRNYSTGVTPDGYLMPFRISVSAADAANNVSIPVSLRLPPYHIDLEWYSPEWNRKALRINTSCTELEYFTLHRIHTKIPVCLSVSEAYSGITPSGAYTADRIFSEAMDYTYLNVLTEREYVVSRGRAAQSMSYIQDPQDKYIYFYDFHPATLYGNAGAFASYYSYDVHGWQNDDIWAWNNFQNCLLAKMHVYRTYINIELSGGFSEIFQGSNLFTRVPIEIGDCPSDVSVYINGIKTVDSDPDWSSIVGPN